MKCPERRSLKQCRLTIGLLLGWLVGFATGIFAQGPPAFEVLVVGDSHISGQGLREKNKFYFLATEWIQNNVFGPSRLVNLKVKAHAGSRINIHPEELEAMQRSGDDINEFRYVEANLSAPSINMQIDVARREYERPEAVNLVMLSGCITDVLVADIVSPFYPERKLRKRIHRFCNGSMSGLLEHAIETFPNAKIVVIGYAPIASRQSDMKKTARYFMRVISFPRKLEWIFTNPLSRMVLKPFRNQFAKRSALWIRGSNREIRDAIATINGRYAEPKVFFVPSPIPEEQSYGTKDTLVWEIGENHLPNDETYDERKTGCADVFSEMKYQHYGRLSLRMCELSSIAHPNVAGSAAFAEAIIKSLKANVFNRSPMPALSPPR